ncbi:MAG: antitoxin [Desulfamplus sp.]|nr:antitoxin [Desulfamplus sp.]
MKKPKLDKEEQEIVDSVNRGEWQSAGSKDDFRKYSEIAKNTLKKDRRINIRVSGTDIAAIQIRAVDEGIPYQTFISSVLHKFALGKLVEKV